MFVSSIIQVEAPAFVAAEPQKPGEPPDLSGGGALQRSEKKAGLAQCALALGTRSAAPPREILNAAVKFLFHATQCVKRERADPSRFARDRKALYEKRARDTRINYCGVPHALLPLGQARNFARGSQ
jgi:hypothetical protein